MLLFFSLTTVAIADGELDRQNYVEAKLLLNKKKWAEAAIVLRAVVKNNPESASAVIDLARALTYSGRREEALGVFSQALTKQSGLRRENLVDRMKTLSRLFLTNRVFQVYQDGLTLLEAGKYRLARERFEKALEEEPDNVEILVRIGQCLVLENDYDSAAERLRFAKRLNPHEPEVSLWLGRAMHQRGEIKEGLEHLASAYAGLQGSERAPIWYSEALIASGQRKAANTVLEENNKAQPFHLVGLVTLAKIRMQAPRESAEALWNARKDLQLALSRLPKYLSGELPRFEGELGIEMRRAGADLKSEIGTLLAQLDRRLQETPVKTAK